MFLDAFAKAFAGTDARPASSAHRSSVRRRTRPTSTRRWSDSGWPIASSSAGTATTSRPSWPRSTSSCTRSTVPEPFGQVVVEAMGVGRPIIAAAAGGPLEIVTDGTDGLLTPPGDRMPWPRR